MHALIIQAAGASQRLGTPKQALMYKGRSLLQHAVHAALASVCRPVIVVTGAYAEKILPDIAHEPVHIVHNAHWIEGMASSIHCGLMHLQRVAPQAASALFMLCDQPFADTVLLDSLVQTQLDSGKGIACCFYNDTTGVPALFSRAYFPALLSLKGQEGARQLFKRYADEVVTIPFPSGSIDIDKPADVEMLNRLNHD